VKRHGQLWDRLVSFPNLLRAARRAARGKRRLANVARFQFNLEEHLCRLQDELREGSYRPGPYRTFEIYEPKRRLISAAPFRDRIVHHALCNVLEPIFERGFDFDSYACRRGKGTHAAVDRFTFFAHRFRYVLKCDVQKYFPSIDHQLLKDRLARKIKDRRVLELAGCIIDHSNPQEDVCEWYAGDDLFGPAERRRGLPLGNQTSQFFANVYLDGFDHWVKQTLRVRGYLRYVDDFVLFGNDKGELADHRSRCREYLAGLRLRLHPDKSVISHVRDGTRFLGYCVYRYRRRLPAATVTRLRRRLDRLEQEFEHGEVSPDGVRRRLASWWGHVYHGQGQGLLLALLAGRSFVRRAP
jgi:retron-type reverse transcriptase